MHALGLQYPGLSKFQFAVSGRLPPMAAQLYAPEQGKYWNNTGLVTTVVELNLDFDVHL